MVRLLVIIAAIFLLSSCRERSGVSTRMAGSDSFLSGPAPGEIRTYSARQLQDLSQGELEDSFRQLWVEQLRISQNAQQVQRVNKNYCKEVSALQSRCVVRQALTRHERSNTVGCAAAKQGAVMAKILEVSLSIKGAVDDRQFGLLANGSYRADGIDEGREEVRFSAIGGEPKGPLSYDEINELRFYAINKQPLPAIDNLELSLQLGGETIADVLVRPKNDSDLFYLVDLSKIQRYLAQEGCALTSQQASSLVSSLGAVKQDRSKVAIREFSTKSAALKAVAEAIVSNNVAVQELQAAVANNRNLFSELFGSKDRGCFLNEKVRSLTLSFEGSLAAHVDRGTYDKEVHFREDNTVSADQFLISLSPDWSFPVDFTDTPLIDGIYTVPVDDIPSDVVVGSIQFVKIRRMALQFDNNKNCWLDTFFLKSCNYHVFEKTVPLVSGIVIKANNEIVYHKLGLDLAFDALHPMRWQDLTLPTLPPWVKISLRQTCTEQ